MNSPDNITSTTLQTIKKISAKRQKHLERQYKKMTNHHSKEERQLEVHKCIIQLNKLGLSSYYNEDTQEIHKMLNDYVEDGEARSGHKEISGTKRVFWYMLPTNKNTEISTCLKYNENA